jgi:YD repeat-containing protein
MPASITPNSTGELATSYTYTNALNIASVTGPNQAQAAVTYNAAGRPATSVSVHGATTTYAYDAITITATTNSHWTRTTLDGLGRKIKTEIGDSGGAKSVVDVEYDSCACSPLGKIKRVSQPYAPGGTVYWTTYSYDAVGRTTRIDLPGGTGATTYVYQGNTTTVTDAAGKWKKYTVDAMGNLIQVTEPAPEGGTHETYYAYNLRNQLTQVTMPRGTVTQTRSFNYDLATGRLMSVTNPENGTVSYTYNADGTLATKTDAKRQRTEYSYDQFKRVTEIRHYIDPYNPTQDDYLQRVSFTYDTAENGWGRLASAQTTLDEYTSFKYTPGGLIREQNWSGVTFGCGFSSIPITVLL